VQTPQRLHGSLDRYTESAKRDYGFDGVSSDALDEEDVWHTLLGPNDVRCLSLEQLDDFYRIGVVDERTFLWKRGMPDWKTLETVIAEHPEASLEETEKPFHVLMPDGSTRILTVEQLDDFYRVGVIDDSTYLWQEGLSSWQTLASLADPNETETVAPPTQSCFHKDVASTHERSVTHGVVNDATRSSHAEPSHTRTVSPNALASHVANATVVPPFLSAPPIAISVAPTPQATTARPQWLLRVGLAATALLVLGRNDVFYALADAIHQKPVYVSSEQRAFGGPSFGTTRAVEQLVASTGGPLEPVRIPIVTTQRTTYPATVNTTSKPNPTFAKEDSDKTFANSSEIANKSSRTAPTTTLSSHVAATLLGQTAKTKPVTPSTKPNAYKRSRKSSKRTVSGSSNYYDPLNGAL
jgi:hypothetical protein